MGNENSPHGGTSRIASPSTMIPNNLQVLSRREKGRLPGLLAPAHRPRGRGLRRPTDCASWGYCSASFLEIGQHDGVGEDDEVGPTVADAHRLDEANLLDDAQPLGIVATVEQRDIGSERRLTGSKRGVDLYG